MHYATILTRAKAEPASCLPSQDRQSPAMPGNPDPDTTPDPDRLPLPSLQIFQLNKPGIYPVMWKLVYDRLFTYIHALFFYRDLNCKEKKKFFLKRLLSLDAIFSWVIPLQFSRSRLPQVIEVLWALPTDILSSDTLSFILFVSNSR